MPPGKDVRTGTMMGYQHVTVAQHSSSDGVVRCSVGQSLAALLTGTFGTYDLTGHPKPTLSPDCPVNNSGTHVNSD